MMRLRPSALTAIALSLTACAATEPRRSIVGAQMHFLDPYIEPLARSCRGGFELTLHPLSPWQIATDPPTDESTWTLRACEQTLKFSLDCRTYPELGSTCAAHEWPIPTPFSPDEERALTEIIERATCGSEAKCVACGAPGSSFTLKRVFKDDHVTRYEISVCDVTQVFESRCHPHRRGQSECEIAALPSR
jgi:hypothetical protein